MDAAAKTAVDALKTVTKKVTHKAVEATREFREKTIYGRQEFKKCWRNNYCYRAKKKNIEQIKTSIIKWNTIKYQSY